MNTSPVVVLGVPDAGVHRLAAMLGRHPQARPLPELSLCLTETVEELQAMADMADEGVIDGLLRALAFHFGPGQTDAGIAAAGEWLRRRADWPTRTVLVAMVERLRPCAPTLPETRAGWRPAWLDAELGAVPGTRFIHLLRHPRTQCTEIAARLRRESFVPPDYKDFGAPDWPRIDPQLAWFRINRNIDNALSGLSPDLRCRLRLEDLTSDVASSLGMLADWLDWPNSGDVLERMLHPEAGTFSGVGPAAAPGGGDAAFLHEPGFSGEPRRRLTLAGPLPWREDIAGFAGEVEMLAQEFGYR